MIKILIEKYFIESSYSKTIMDEVIDNDNFILSEYRRISGTWEKSIDEDQNMIVFGSIQFVQDALSHFPNSCAFFSDRDYDYSNFDISIPDKYQFNKGEYLPWGSLKRRDFNECFVRSDSGLKVLPGMVISKDDMENVERSNKVSDRSMVFVSSTKNIDSEYRLYIKDGEIITGSRYMEGNEISPGPLSNDVIEWFKSCEELSHPDRLYTLDVSKRNGTYRFLEFNAASTSDFYFSDVSKIFKSALEIIKEENGQDCI